MPIFAAPSVGRAPIALTTWSPSHCLRAAGSGGATRTVALPEPSSSPSGSAGAGSPDPLPCDVAWPGTIITASAAHTTTRDDLTPKRYHARATGSRELHGAALAHAG